MKYLGILFIFSFWYSVADAQNTSSASTNTRNAIPVTTYASETPVLMPPLEIVKSTVASGNATQKQAGTAVSLVAEKTETQEAKLNLNIENQAVLLNKESLPASQAVTSASQIQRTPTGPPVLNVIPSEESEK
ncbi:MAG: hypothetical protein KDD41_07145 [Flavobacteriales bacterium]|nr:hypothetical protein [Flavobacteriales bacterium]